jgi:hypothetical protein
MSNSCKTFGQPRETYNLLFCSFCKKQLDILQKFLENFFLGCSIVLAIMGIVCSLMISGRLYRLKEISLLPKTLGTLEKSWWLKKILEKNFQDAQNISGSFGIYLPNNVGHIRNVTNFQFYSQKCWALWKIPMIQIIIIIIRQFGN